MKKYIIVIFILIIMIPTSVFAETIDYSKRMPTPDKQNGNTCVGWATWYALNFYTTKYVGATPYFIYNKINNNDQGAYIYSGPELLQKVRIITNYSSITLKDQDWVPKIKKILDNGDVLITAVPVFKDFVNIGWNNPTYDTIDGETMETMIGWHAVTIIGYNDDKKAFKFINSWGKDWGLNGYGYIDYELATYMHLKFYKLIF